MRENNDPTHEPHRLLYSQASIPFDGNVISQAERWITSSLSRLGVSPQEQKRISLALSQHIEGIPTSNELSSPPKLTLRLFSTGAASYAGCGWGFFIVNKPSRADRVVLELFVYPGPKD